MNTQHLREIVPHYVAMILLLLVVFRAVSTLLEGDTFWIEMAAGLAVVIAYRPLVIRLGIAPSAWENH